MVDTVGRPMDIFGMLLTTAVMPMDTQGMLVITKGI